MRQPIRLPELTPEAIQELAALYRTTRDVRLRARSQMILLAAEQGLAAPAIARIVRVDEDTVLLWLKRYVAEGINGLADKPRPGGPAKVTPEYRERLVHVVHQRPRSLGQPYSMWTLQRLAGRRRPRPREARRILLLRRRVQRQLAADTQGHVES